MGAARAELVLGTVQLGLDYGIANTNGMPDEGQAAAIVHAALDAGIRVFDTARDYGESEARLGQLLADQLDSVHIVTKLDPLRGLDDADDLPAIDHAVSNSVHASLVNLGVERLDTLLLHRPEHLMFGKGRIWARLRALQSDGPIGALGVSVQTPEEAKAMLAMDGVAHLQLPLNLLDWRWRESGIPSELHERPDVTVHVRSAYLQGLLVAHDPSIWPEIEGVEPKAIYATLDHFARVYQRSGAADLCLAYLRGQPWIDGVVIGMETVDQVRENAQLWSSEPLSREERAELESALPVVPANLLNPAVWHQT